MVRLAAIAVVGFSSLRFGDAPAYLFAANALAKTGHYPLRTDAYFFRPPGYPVFLVAATLGTLSIPLAKVANTLLGAAAAVLLAALSARLFGRRALALATGIAAAVAPGLVLISTDVQSEPLFILLLLVAAFLLLAAADRPSSGLALGSGAALALAALTRPSALALAVLLLAPLGDRRYPRRVRAHLAASALLGFLLALAPWTLRNALVFRELIPVNDGAGVVFYQGNSDWAVRFYALRDRAEYDRWIDGVDQAIRRETEALDGAGLTSPSHRSRRFAALALADRRGRPRRLGTADGAQDLGLAAALPESALLAPRNCRRRRRLLHDALPLRRGRPGAIAAARRAPRRRGLSPDHDARPRGPDRSLALSHPVLGSDSDPVCRPRRERHAPPAGNALRGLRR